MSTSPLWIKRTRALAAVSFAATLGLGLSACGSDDNASGSPSEGEQIAIPEYDGPEPSSSNPVKVGILYTDDNPIGVAPEIRDAAEAAVKYINAHGGIGGRTVEIVACNGQNNPQSDARCAAQFVEEKVLTVYGLDGVWGSVGVSIIDKAGIVNQTLPISGPEFTAENAYPWQGSGITAAAAAASYAAEQGGDAACVYTDVASFEELCKQNFGAVADGLGVKWTAVPIPPTATDLAQYATKASGTEAKTVLLIGGGPTIQQMVNASTQIGFKPNWIIPSQRPDIWESLGASAEGLIYFDDQTYAYDDSDEDAALFRAVMEKYEPDAPYTAYATMAFSNLLTLQRLGEQAGGDQITAENLPKLLGAIKLDQFMGPELDASKALPLLPHAVRTGAYLYTHKADGDEPAGKGYYEVPQ